MCLLVWTEGVVFRRVRGWLQHGQFSVSFVGVLLGFVLSVGSQQLVEGWWGIVGHVAGAVLALWAVVLGLPDSSKEWFRDLKGKIREGDGKRLIGKVRGDWVDPILGLLPAGAKKRIDLRIECYQGNREEGGGAGRVLEGIPGLSPGGMTVVLGGPGAGKTTLLIEWVKCFLALAENGREARVPVVFPLAGWAKNRTPLEDWMKAELRDRYGELLSKAALWVRRDEIIPFLDGLDEVPAAYRRECVEEIERYLESYGDASVVVSCREEEFHALGASFSCVEEIILIRPLDPNRVRAFFGRAGQSLAGLAEVFETDRVVQELLDSPLMVVIASDVYAGLSAEDVRAAVAAGEVSEYRERLFAEYVDKMISWPRATPPLERENTLRWLGWLAAMLEDRNEDVFYLDRLQFDWLPGRHRRALATHFLVAFIFCGGVVGLLTGLSGGLFRRLIENIASGEIVQVMSGNAGIGLYESNPYMGLVAWLAGGWSSGLFLGVVATLGAWVAYGSHTQVRLGEFSWSPRRSLRRRGLPVWAGQGILFGLAVGLVFSALLAVVTTLRVDFVPDIFNTLALGILPWIGIGLASGFLIGALSSVIRDLKETTQLARRSPNALIVRSCWNGLIAGAIAVGFFGLIGLILGLSLNDIEHPLDGLFAGCVAGTVFGVALAWKYGFGAYTWHCVLRSTLRQQGCLSRDPVTFFNTAADRSLLRSTAGGYRYLHPDFQAYFAKESRQKETSLHSMPSPFRRGLARYMANTSILIFAVFPHKPFR